MADPDYSSSAGWSYFAGVSMTTARATTAEAPGSPCDALSDALSASHLAWITAPNHAVGHEDKTMMSYFAGIVDFIGGHPHYAQTAIFLLALSEAIPVVGTIVPGSTLIIGKFGCSTISVATGQI
jgi:hypothetical protein